MPTSASAGRGRGVGVGRGGGGASGAKAGAARAAGSAPAVSMLSSDSSDRGTPAGRPGLVGRPEIAGTSPEFERLMRDSVESDSGCIAVGGGIAPLLRTPPGAPQGSRSSPAFAGGVGASPALRTPQASLLTDTSPAVPPALPQPVGEKAAAALAVLPDAAHAKIVDVVALAEASSTEAGAAAHISVMSLAGSPVDLGSMSTIMPAAMQESPGDFACLGLRAESCGTLWAASPLAETQEQWERTELSRRVEDICRELKRSVEHEFALAARQMTARHHASSEAQRLKAEAEACKQQALFQATYEERQQLSSKVELKQRQLKGTLQLIQRTRGGLASRCSLQLAMSTWSAAIAASKGMRLQQLLAARLQETHSKSLVFGAWRREAQAVRREALVAHERAVAEMVRCKLFEQLEHDKERLVAEGEQLRRQLVEEARLRSLQQENLKRVFTRGVCALNYEAMSLLSDPSGTVAGGAEPCGKASSVVRDVAGAPAGKLFVAPAGIPAGALTRAPADAFAGAAAGASEAALISGLSLPAPLDWSRLSATSPAPAAVGPALPEAAASAFEVLARRSSDRAAIAGAAFAEMSSSGLSAAVVATPPCRESPAATMTMAAAPVIATPAMFTSEPPAPSEGACMIGVASRIASPASGPQREISPSIAPRAAGGCASTLGLPAQHEAAPAHAPIESTPRQAPVPLPFVSYSGTPGGPETMSPCKTSKPGSGAGQGHTAQQHALQPKGLRWQAAPMPRGGHSASGGTEAAQQVAAQRVH